MSAAQLTSAKDAAVAALTAGNYPEARRQLVIGQTIINMTPDSDIGDMSKLEWGRNFDSVLRQVKALEEDGVGDEDAGCNALVACPVQFVDPDTVEYGECSC